MSIERETQAHTRREEPIASSEQAASSPEASIGGVFYGQQLPAHPRASLVRQALVQRMQREQGNRYVQRVIQRQRNVQAVHLVQRDDTVQTSPLGGGQHTVLPGDSLWQIAENTYGDGKYWRDIYQANPGKIGRDGCLILNSSILDLPTIDVPVASTNASANGSTSAPPAPDDRSSTPIGPPAPPPSQPAAPPAAPSQSTAPPATSQSTAPPNQTPASGAGSVASRSRSCMYPTFRYNLPTIPVSIAPLPTPAGLLVFSLSLRGNFNVQKQGTCLPWSIDQSGLRVEANEVVNQFTHGIRISGIGSDGMSLGTTFAGDFNSSEVRFTPPSSMTFIAQTRNISFEFSGLRVAGDFGFEMRVDYEPLPPVPAPPPVSAPEPRVDWGRILAIGGGIVLIVGAVALTVGTIAEDVATAGAGTVDDPISFATAAGMLQQGTQLVTQ